MSKKTTSAILGFLMGAAAGTVAGILIAPDKGVKTRKEIKKRARKATEEFQGNLDAKVDDLRSYFTEFVDDVKGRFSELEKEVKDKTKETTKKATEAAEKVTKSK
jgi:gas vesicle protein